MLFLLDVMKASWTLLLQSGIFILFGIIIGGFIKVFLRPATVARHLGKGKVLPVIKAALFGIPIPLCSCGVLPAAAALKKQGANTGATAAFLVATPESGVDSISITLSLLDPIMTVARPLAAFFTAVVTGIAENLFVSENDPNVPRIIDKSCSVDNCCDGNDCPPKDHANHHSLGEKLYAGLRFAFTDLWSDLAGWFLIGLLLGGVITVLVPEELLGHYLGGGLLSMLVMLMLGIPLYICATASTPIAAALILKGVSPGAALVFLLAGPATNITSLSVLVGLLGRKATAIYLISLSVCTVLSGLLLDRVYAGLGISARAAAGQATELVPHWMAVSGAVIILALSLPVVFRRVRSFAARIRSRRTGTGAEAQPPRIIQTREITSSCPAPST